MDPKTEYRIIRDMEEEKKELDHIEKSLEYMRTKLLLKIPSKFSKRDLVNSFFGALILGLTFIFRGSTVPTAVGLSNVHIMIIIVLTILILVAEIYYIGYSRVPNKSKRKLGQFITKRLTAFYMITVTVSFLLIYLLNIDENALVGSFSDVVKIVILMSFPCAIGAAVPSLLKQY